MFNLKAQSAVKPLHTRLTDDASATKVTNDGTKTQARALRDVGTNEDIIDTQEKLLSANRIKHDDVSTEKQMEASSGSDGPARNAEFFNGDVKPLDLLNKAQEQERLARIRESDAEDNRDNFWDDFAKYNPAVKTTEYSGVENSQLQNHVGRFEKLPTDVMELADKSDFYSDMVTATLSELDSGLTVIYANAEANNRELSDDERKIESSITEAKISVISQVMGDDSDPNVLVDKIEDLRARMAREMRDNGWTEQAESMQGRLAEMIERARSMVHPQ
jgi:hypothetical protein